VQTKIQIQDDVRAALRSDPRIKHPELIAVSVDEIGTVVLHGTVGHLPQRLAAVHDAREVDGVFEVIADDLKVHPQIGDRRSDSEIGAAATQRVIDDARIHSDHVHLKVSHGWVTLTGYVRHQSEREAAIEDVVTLSGVVGVDDEIEVR
jgi:osmotically-inducible protein OsmY